MYCVPEMRMSNVQAKLASAFLLSVAASAGLTAGPSSVARAADSCITEPKVDSPQGKHWYYRIERGTARHCWYLRGEDEASARTPVADPVATAKPAPQTTGNAPATRSLADARAEFTPKARVEDNSSAPPARSVWPDPQAAILAPAAPATATTGIGPGAGAPNAPVDSQLASRWPQASGAPATATAAPRAPPMVADAEPTETAAPVAAELPQVSPPPTREVGSLQKLALVAFGALALAGISGSLVYRLAGARWRRRREARWPQRQPAPSLSDEARGAPWVAPELSPTVPHVDVAHEDAEHEDVAADRIEFGKSDDSFDKIEDFLARLTRQLQDELQTTHSTELENPRPQ
jgi:hypothetical protein